MNKTLCYRMILVLLVVMLPFSSIFLRYGNRGMAVQSVINTPQNGVWMHVDTFMNEPDEVLDQYADTLVRSNIQTVFILAKKIDGSVNFPSPHALKRSFSGDPMKRLIERLKSRNIKVFFYFPINTDPAWNSANPQDIAWQMGSQAEKKPLQDPTRRLVNLTSAAYREYILRLVQDALSKYPLDGIQLDYIRYRNGHWGFSETENAMARQRGINIERVQDLSYQTFVKPGDWRTLLHRYDEGDRDVVSWVNMREDIVFNFAQYISQHVRKQGKMFSLTLVHAGALGTAYGAVHFSQSYERLSSIADIAVPMAYHGTEEKIEDFVLSVIDGAKKKIASTCLLMIGLQAYETSTQRMNIAIQSAKQRNIGFVLFRVGTFSFVHLDYQMLHPERIQVNAKVFHGIPAQEVHGLEVRGLGGWLKLAKDTWSLHQAQYPDGFKVWGETFFTKMGQKNLSFMLELTTTDLNGFMEPYALLADQKKDLPTLTTSSISFQHYQLCPHTMNLRISKGLTETLRFQLHQGVTYIHADDLAFWGITPHYDMLNNELTLNQGFRKLTFHYSNETLHITYFPETMPMQYPQALPWGIFSWVPLRLVFELTGYYVFYSIEHKMIHLLRAEGCSSAVLSTAIHEWEDEAWLWNTSDQCTFMMEDFLQTDFYQLVSLVHQKGRKAVLRFHPSWNYSSHGESLYWMMQRDIPRWYQPDKLEWQP